MIALHIAITILCSCCSLTTCIIDESPNDFHRADNLLILQLKQRFLETHVKWILRNGNTVETPRSLRDFNLHVNEYEVAVSDVHLLTGIEIEFIRTQANLFYNNVETEFQVSRPIIFNATVRIFTEENELLQSDCVTFYMQNVDGTANFGVQPHLASDTYKATNVQLHFTTEDWQFETYQVEKSTKEINRLIASHLRNTSLANVIEDTVSKLFAESIKEISIAETFGHNRTAIATYNTRSQELVLLANQVVDGILQRLRNYITTNEKESVHIDDIKLDFTFIANFAGRFEAVEGVASDLGTMQRLDDFSLTITDDVYEIFGCIGLKRFEVEWDEYSAVAPLFAAKGKLNGVVGSNSVQLIAFVNTTNINQPLKYKLNVKELSEIKLTATGSGYFYDLIVSRIFNWVSNAFQDTIKRKVEDELNNIVNKFIRDKL